MLRLFAVILCSFLALAAGVHAWLEHELAHAITITPVSEMVSPKGEWKALVDETFDEPGFGGAVVTDTVHLTKMRDPAKVVDILSVDSSGHDIDRPRIVWTAGDVLQVTVQNLSYVTVLRRDYGPVRIDLQFDPDDPATRAAWLKWLHEPRRPESTAQIAKAPSPDGAWIAEVHETRDGDHFFPLDTVSLIRAHNPSGVVEMLRVGTTERGRGPPRIVWTAADELQVIVPNLAFLFIDKREYAGVRLDLRFNPDNPAARAAWLKQLYAPDSPPPEE